MRLSPIEKPRGLVLRASNWLMRRRFGRSISPFQVIFPRLPRALWAQFGIYAGLSGRGLPLEPELQHVLQQHTASLNGCSFCIDIGRAMATYQGLTVEKLDATRQWRTSPLFSESERAALRYVEESTLERRVSDETFAALRRHFDERQIVAITWLNAVENFFNLLNGPLEIESDGLCAIADRRVKGAA
jgi:AhpD family alkylhydroperoxidase